MQKAASAATLLIAFTLAGCASSTRDAGATLPPSASPPTGTSSAAQAERIAAPVSIPRASSRRVVLVLSGSKVVVESKDWPEMKREWKDTFAEHARDAGIGYSFADVAPAPGSEDGTLLNVDIADYRIVGIGARIFFGAMTGNAFIDGKVSYLNLRDGRKFGEQQYNTSSSAWGGVFAKVTPQQVDQIATGVFTELKQAK